MGKRVNIELKDKTHSLAKVLAVLKDITLNDYFEKAIEDAIEKDKDLIERLRK